MRQVGSLLKEQDAERFADFLLTKGIHCHVERDKEEWALWIREEDHLNIAQQELEDYRRAPDDPRYHRVTVEAQAIRQEKIRRREEARRNWVEMPGRWRHGEVRRRCPLVFVLIGICVFVALVTGNRFDNTNKTYQLLNFKSPTVSLSEDPMSDPFRDVKKGQVWRMVTPIFLHAGILHLGFNMYWLFFLGGQVEDVRGSRWFLFFIFATAIVSVTAQAIIESPFGGGMSGVVYALFGFVWIRWRYFGEAGFVLSQLTVILMIVFFFYGFSLDQIANTAHAFGFGFGILIAFAPSMFKGKA